MKAGWYKEFGTAGSVLEIGDMAVPETGPDDVLVRLYASGVNPSDVKKRAGYGEPFAEDREKDTGYWICRVPVAPGRHEYAFLVNGEKILPDPNAPFSRYDGFGNFNSVIFATPVKNEKI